MSTLRAVRNARLSLLTLGAGSVVVQVVLLREILAIFAGSELTAGVALGLWLLCTGLGSLLGSWLGDPPPLRLLAGHITLAFLPFTMLAAMRGLPLVTDVRGAAPGLPVALLGSLSVFLPYGLLSGGMVPVLGRLAGGAPATSQRSRGLEGEGTRWAYALDSAGCAAGGLMLGIALAMGLPHGLCLVVAGTSHAVMAGCYLHSAIPGDRAARSAPPLRWRRLPVRFALPLQGVGLAASLAGCLFAVGAFTDQRTRGWSYPGQEVLLVRNTPFGQLAVTRTGAQRNLLQDAIPLTSTGDLSAETRVHPALCQVPRGSRVLLLGGSIAGSLRETMLHHPDRVDCVEIDATIYALGKTATTVRAIVGVHPVRDASFPEPALGAPEVRLFTGDGRAFVRRHRGEYDAILLNIPGPENAQLNRFYTEEFFREARAALRPGGIVSFLLPSSPNYLGSEQLALERSIAGALEHSFSDVTVLPGESHVYLAGDHPADLDIEPILSARGIVTRRLLDYDWAELSDPFRRDGLRALLLGQQGTQANRDLAPVAFRHFLALRARIDAGGTRLVQVIVGASIVAALLACVPGWPGRRTYSRSSVAPGTTRGTLNSRSSGGTTTAPPGTLLLAVATSGFSAMALEFGVLLLFQVIFGNLYLRLSLLVALFLAGAAIGALMSPRLPWTARTQVRLADAALIVAALALWAIGAVGTGILIASASDIARGIAGYLLLPLLALVASIPIGVQFAAAGRVAPATRQEAPPAGTQREESATGAFLRAGARAHSSSVLGRLYLADLAGAASGTMVAGLWLLPHGGLPAVVVAVVVIKAVSLALQSFTGRTRSPCR